MSQTSPWSPSRHVLVDLCERRAVRRARQLLQAADQSVDKLRCSTAVLSALRTFDTWMDGSIHGRTMAVTMTSSNGEGRVHLPFLRVH